MLNQSPVSLAELLKQRAADQPKSLAILAPGVAGMTYEGLYRQITNTVEQLNILGVGRNDRVAIVLPNGPEMAVAFLAVAAAQPARRSTRPMAAANLLSISPIWMPKRW